MIFDPHSKHLMAFYQERTFFLIQFYAIFFLVLMYRFWKTLRDSLIMVFSSADTTSESFQKQIAQKLFQLAINGSLGSIIVFSLSILIAIQHNH